MMRHGKDRPGRDTRAPRVYQVTSSCLPSLPMANASAFIILLKSICNRLSSRSSPSATSPEETPFSASHFTRSAASVSLKRLKITEMSASVRRNERREDKVDSFNEDNAIMTLINNGDDIMMIYSPACHVRCRQSGERKMLR